MFSIATNVTSKDAVRIKNVLPNWLAEFNNYIEEIIIVYDRKPTEGRISSLHESIEVLPFDIYMDQIKRIDSRIGIIDLDYGNSDEILSKWFDGNSKPIRCQGGTPIYAFIYGIEKSNCDFVLRADCDMVFYDNGFIKNILEGSLFNNFDFIEVSRTGKSQFHFSSRAFFINKRRTSGYLPMHAYKLDLLRMIHRKVYNKPVYLAFEQMIQKEILKNKIKREILPRDLGYSMHIPTLADFYSDDITDVIRKFTSGSIPCEQLLQSENYHREFWL